MQTIVFGYCLGNHVEVAVLIPVSISKFFSSLCEPETSKEK